MYDIPRSGSGERQVLRFVSLGLFSCRRKSRAVKFGGKKKKTRESHHSSTDAHYIQSTSDPYSTQRPSPFFFGPFFLSLFFFPTYLFFPICFFFFSPPPLAKPPNYKKDFAYHLQVPHTKPRAPRSSAGRGCRLWCGQDFLGTRFLFF